MVLTLGPGKYALGPIGVYTFEYISIGVFSNFFLVLKTKL